MNIIHNQWSKSIERLRTDGTRSKFMRILIQLQWNWFGSSYLLLQNCSVNNAFTLLAITLENLESKSQSKLETLHLMVQAIFDRRLNFANLLGKSNGRLISSTSLIRPWNKHINSVFVCIILKQKEITSFISAVYITKQFDRLNAKIKRTLIEIAPFFLLLFSGSLLCVCMFIEKKKERMTPDVWFYVFFSMCVFFFSFAIFFSWLPFH